MKRKHSPRALHSHCSGDDVCPMMVLRHVFLLCAVVFTPIAVSADISGIWKHAQEPVWIEVSVEEGSATVVRNDRSPDRVGRTLLKYLEADKSKQGLWHGLVYVEKMGDYKDVQVSLSDNDRMHTTGKVGFMSRTVEWVRVDKIR